MIWLWIGFIFLILSLLALDLGVFHRKDHVFTIREALIWTGIWITCSLIFDVAVYYIYENHLFNIGAAVLATASDPGHPATSGRDAAFNYLAGFLIEKSLSLDNIFVMALIFTYFKVPNQYQHRVLFWGIMGALLMRGIMIGAGTALIAKFTWMTYVFGLLLLYSAFKLMFSGDDEFDPESSRIITLARRIYPVSHELDGHNFFTTIKAPDPNIQAAGAAAIPAQMIGRRAMTPLFLILLLVESTDILFAVDSIPAIFAVTYDPFIVFTSNIFAILGLRSLYFALAGLLALFRYMKASLVILLSFVAIKMLIHAVYIIPTSISLAVIVAILGCGVAASVLIPPSAPEASAEAAGAQQAKAPAQVSGTAAANDPAQL